jgi:hypothetical protein
MHGLGEEIQGYNSYGWVTALWDPKNRTEKENVACGSK